MDTLKKQFELNGYCIIEDFLNPEGINKLKERCEYLIENMPQQENRSVFSTLNSENEQNKDKYFLDSSDKISYFYEAGALGPKGELLVDPKVSLNKIGHALHDLDPVFKEVTFSERIKELCYQLGFVKPQVVQSMYIFKNAGIGGEVNAHQDASFLYTDPVKLTGIWIALDDATLENGCLKFIPGSHKGGVHRRYVRNPEKGSEELLTFDRQAPVYPASSFTPVPVKKGTCVIIDGLVVHCSAPNKTPNPRHVYTFHVIEGKEGVEYSNENWIQPVKKPFLDLYKMVV